MKPVAVENAQGDVIQIFLDAVEYYDSIGWKVVASKPSKAKKAVVESTEEVESE